MNKTPQLKKVISILLIPILIIHLSGCITSRKTVRPGEIPFSGKYHYYVEGQKVKLGLEDINNSGITISGKINNIPTGYSKSIRIHVLADSLISVGPTGIIYIPVEAIDKIEKTEYSTGGTLALVLGCFLAMVIVIGLSNFSFDAGLQGI